MFISIDRRRRSRRAVGVCAAAVAAAAATLLVPAPASAYHPMTTAQCPQIWWSDDAGRPRIVLHVAEFRADGASVLDEDRLIDALVAVNVEFDKVGGTTADIGSILVSTDPFDFTNWYGDTTPTLHIGFEDDPTYPASAVPGPTSVTPDDGDADTDPECRYSEAHIRFNLPSTTDWNFGTPGTYFFQAGKNDSAGDPYFRQTYLHELLHAFGLQHADATYSFLNYGDRPWANRSADQQIRPLPDEIRWLRHRYPATTTRDEVAVLNTWLDDDEPLVEGAATAKRLCGPSRGAFSSDPFATRCGDQRSEAIVVCEGDKLRVRFALANYSTGTYNAYAELYFSYDLTLDTGGDVRSNDYHFVSRPAAHSAMYGLVFTVPDIVDVPGAFYWPIVRVIGTVDANNDGVVSGNEVAEDWIPLTAAVQNC